jgi:hypothetical protein
MKIGSEPDGTRSWVLIAGAAQRERDGANFSRHCRWIPLYSTVVRVV